MSIAYIVLAHKNPEQVARLVKRLATPSSMFLVHVDRRAADAVYDGIVAGLQDVERVRYLERIPCYWGGFGIPRAMLMAIDALESDTYGHAVSLSGQDYPLRPAAEIEGFFDGHGERSFIDACELPSTRWPNGGTDRFDRWWWHWELFGRRFHVPNRFLPLRIPRKLPPALVPHLGSLYWALTRDAADYVRDFNRARPEVARFFEHVDIPDESYFHTVLASSPLASTIIHDDLHYIDWSAGLPSPRVLTVEDLPALAASGALFARKFDIAVDAAVLDRLDAR